MSLYKHYGVDAKKHDDGVWVDYPANDDKSVPAFLLRRAGKSNKAWTSRFEEVTKPYRRQMELGVMDAKASEALTLKAWVGTVLVGWRNVQDEKGKSLGAFTNAKAEKLMTDLPDLFDDLWKQTSNGGLFRPEAPEEDAKNS